MTAIFVTAIGVGAAVCSMGSFIPQAIKVIRDRDAGSVSLRMYIVTVLGFALWTAYGLTLQSWPLVASNLISFALAGLILILKLKYPYRLRQEAALTLDRDFVRLKDGVRCRIKLPLNEVVLTRAVGSPVRVQGGDRCPKDVCTAASFSSSKTNI